MTIDPSKRLPLKFDETNPIQNPTTTKSSTTSQDFSHFTKQY
jgi:hypothetical protein